MITEAKESIKRRSMDWGKALVGAGKHVPFVEEYNPDQLAFIRGFAKGSGIPFEELFVLNCLDEKGLCTDVMVNGEVTDDGSVYSAHTEDWTVKSQEFLVLVKAKPKGGPTALVMTHAGLEWITGMNSAGISLTGNSLYMNDIRVGVPKLMIAPKVLASKTIGAALAAATPPHRASSYNNNIGHSSGELYNVEGSATDFAVLYPKDGYLVHANHYLHPRMEKYETAFGGPGVRTLEGSSTVVRYHRAQRLVRSQLGDITLDSLTEILRDHVNYPESICRHPSKSDPEHDRCKTTYAMVMDLTKKKMHLCIGNPCEGEFKPYSL
jgi:isopenicillin-N N-acyltransferase-like protein